MAKFLKIQDYYINVEQISSVLIRRIDEVSNVVICGANNEEIKLITDKGELYKLTKDEIANLKNYLSKNLITY